MSVKEYLYRMYVYVFHGTPEYKTTVNVAIAEKGEELKGHRIMITGGNRGIGFAVAKKCLDQGAKVLLVGRSMKRLKEAAVLLNSDNLKLMEMDCSDVSTFANKMDEAEKIMGGRVDSLVNNAGLSIHKTDWSTTSVEQWDAQINLNMRGVYFLTQTFLNRLIEHNMSGNIVMMASERGLYGDDVPYGLAKAAIINYTKGLAKKLITKQIRVNAVAPGVTATDMTGYSPDGNLYRQLAVGKRVLLPEEIAEVTEFLLSDRSNCITGACIPCNEGNTL